MEFADLFALAQKGIGLLSQGRAALNQVKDAVNDGKVALQPGQSLEQLTALLDQEEQETKAAIADARDAIAAYRQG